jgi:hypothetical protein
MNTRSSSTAAATSDVAQRVSRAVRDASEGRSDEQTARITRLITRIQELESRGFIRRQTYSAPTTGDFERGLVYKR